jgi:hypothetical protein
MPQIKNPEPYLISDSMSDQSSSMSGFPAAYHQQLQQQHLISTTPPPAARDLKKQLSFSGLFPAAFHPEPEPEPEPVLVAPNPPIIIETPPAPESQPIPEKKKRGRRKGSKGIDSTLAEASKMLGAELGSHLPTPYNSRTTTPTTALFGPSSTIGSTNTSPTATSYSNAYNDIKNKIASASGPKKVKTTKELLADLQNRKNNNTTDGYSTVSQSILSPCSSSGEFYLIFLLFKLSKIF